MSSRRRRRRHKAKKEKFDLRKFVGGFNLLDGVAWAKSFLVTFRVAIIVGLILAGVYGVGRFQGSQNNPVIVDVSEDVEFEFVDKWGNSHQVEIVNKQFIIDDEIIRVKDIPSLKPYGFELKPKLATGVTTKGEITGGLALEVAHLYDWNLDILGLNKFLGIGLSYDLKYDGWIKIKNTNIGVGIGKNPSNTEETLGLVYISIAF